MLLIIALRTIPEQTVTGGPSTQRQVNVAYVLDGDTFEASDGERVRLLGIDAPEIAHHDTPGEPYGQEAKAALQKLIGGESVLLQFGQEETDRYGRTLAWVYNQNGRLVNLQLLQSGHAKLLASFGLPLQLEPQLREAEANARIQGRGLWGR